MKFLLSILFLVPVLAMGQSLDPVGETAKRDLDDALARLSTLREEIREEKIPLSRRFNTLQQELSTLRRESERVLQKRDSQTLDISNLESNVKLRRDEVAYLSNLLGEYGRSLKVRMKLSELARDETFFAEQEEIDANPDLSREEKVTEQLDYVTYGINRLKDLIGGTRFEGSAVTQTGEIEKGSFGLVGPVTVFASSQGESAGLSMSANSLVPNVAPLNEEADALIRSFVQSGSGNLPLDVTDGNAYAIAATEETIQEHIQKGGIWIYPILIFAGMAALVALYKFFEVYSISMPKPGTLHTLLKLLDEGKRDEALEYAKKVPGPAGRMLHDGVLHSEESKELVEEVLYERMLDVQPKLERLLPFIAVTAATSPLLGLLGTVTGMINTFKLITVFGTGDAKQLSSGISEALITTEFGLIVAIPSLILHALLSRRASGVMANMERMAVAFVNGLTRKS